MTSQRTAFVAPFVGAGLLVWWLVAADRSTTAIAVGIAGILLHWAWSSRGPDPDPELADASYFFGFLLTLIFLSAGLFALGAPTTGGESTPTVQHFLRDLASGLTLTIVGLLVRQLRVLGAPAAGEPAPIATLAAADDEAAASLRELVALLRTRFQDDDANRVESQIDRTRERARLAAESLDRDLALAAARITTAMTDFESAVGRTTDAVLRAGSSLSEGVEATSGRMQIEATRLLSAIQEQRVAADESLRRALEASRETHGEAERQLQAHVEEWRTSLRQAQSFLQTVHTELETEYRRGVTGLSEAGRAFAALSEQVTNQVAALPDPSERLAALWQGVAAAEAGLVGSIGRTTEALEGLHSRSIDATTSIVSLGRATGGAAQQLTTDAGQAAEALRRELRQMDGLLDEFVRVLEQRISAYAR